MCIRDRDMPLYNILKLRPNKNMTATTFWAAVEAIKHHYGDVYKRQVYGISGDWRKVVYWVAAAVLNAAVTF